MTEKSIYRELQFCDTHEEADQINRDFYADLSPQERLDLALELMSGMYAAYPRFERIYRTTELGECPVSSDWGVGI
jgi:hypothetical protein